MPVSNADIAAYLGANPNLSDAAIASAMAQYGVSPTQMAEVTGIGQDVIQSRYEAAAPAPTPPLSMTSAPAASAPEPTFVNPLNNLGAVNNTALASGLSGVISPTVAFTPGLASMSPEKKAEEYAKLTGQGFTDAQIKAAADATFGTQSQSDWDYLKNLAAGAPKTTGVTTGSANPLNNLGVVGNTALAGAFEQGTQPTGIQVKDEVSDTFQSVFGRTPTADELNTLRGSYGYSIEPGELEKIVLSKRDANVGYGGQTLDSTSSGTVNKLTTQILNQGTTGQWRGEGYGSAEKTAADMALLLSAAGITDINQFGQIPELVKAEVQVGADGKPVYGTKQVEWQGGPEDGGYVEVFQPLPDQAKVKVVNGSPVVETGNMVYGNKITGQAINPYYDKAKDNTWSGTFAGEGSTAYKVNFRPDGTPIFYSQYGGSSNDLAQVMDDPIIGAAIQAAAAHFGGPIGTAALNLLAGKDIDDVAKAALTSYVAGQVASGVSGSTDVVNTLGQTGANVAGRVAAATVTGGDPVQALITGGIGAAMPEITANIPGYSDLSLEQKAFVNSAISSTLRDGNLSPQNLVNAAFASGRAALKNTKSAGSIEAPLTEEEMLKLGENRLNKAFSKYDIESEQEAVDARTQELLDEMYGVTSPSDYEEFLRSIGITNQSNLGASLSNQEILDSIGYVDTMPTSADMGTVEIVGERPSVNDMGEVEIIGERPDLEIKPEIPDMGEIEIVDKRPTVDDMGEVEIIGERPAATDMGEIEIIGERPTVEDMGEIEIVGERPAAEPVIPDVGTVEIVGERPASSVSPSVASVPSVSGPNMPSFDWSPRSGFLQSKVTGKAIDPLARVKEIQAEFERDAMMQNVDPRLMQILQQRMDPQQQSQQFEGDIGALAKLLSGGQESSNKDSYYAYGSEDSIDDILGGKAVNYKEGGFVEPLKAEGGMVLPLLAKSGGALGHYKGREDFKDGKHVAGEGDGQSDDIPAWLADGEFVFPADVVSALGNGSTKAGTDKLYEMMHGIRDRARSKGPKDLPPPALKSALDYLKSSKRSTK